MNRRYQAVYTVAFAADDDAQARAWAGTHHRQLADTLQVEGVNHPTEITLLALFSEGQSVLEEAATVAVGT